jgi:hypothetical protein
MKKFDARSYSITDFVEWHDRGLLNLSPEFQRRSVWPTKAKSYLIDTILRGKPIPKILITQQLHDKRTVRSVVDGQQRLRAILEFIHGDFKLSRAHNQEYANLNFEDLPDEARADFYKYEIGVDLLYDIPIEDLLDIFARINTFTVRLNTQEQLNAKYLGYFKQYAYRIGLRYVQYFMDGGVLTHAQVSRMKEAELSSDLLVSLLGGIQTVKNVPQYYKRYEDIEDEPQELRDAEQQFDKIMSYIGELYPSERLKSSNWQRPPLFYSLFNVVAHGLFGIAEWDAPRPETTVQNVGKIRVRLDDISASYDKYTEKESGQDIPAGYRTFLEYARRQTTDTKARKDRARFVCEQLVAL